MACRPNRPDRVGESLSVTGRAVKVDHDHDVTVGANNSGFQRYDHEFPQAPCGPPWIKNFSGYFLLGSNPGGFTRNPCTSSLFAPLNVNGSSGCISI